MKKIILLSLSFLALVLFLNTTNAADKSADVTLKITINEDTTICDFGENLYLGEQVFSYNPLTYTGTFKTDSVGGSVDYWYCEDNVGYADRYVSIESTSVINMDNAALQGGQRDITGAAITITSPQATVDAGSCTAETMSNTNATIGEQAQSLFGKDSAQYEVCKIGMDNLDIKVVTHGSQPVGNYSGTVNIDINGAAAGVWPHIQ